MKQNIPTIYCYGDEVKVMINADGIVLASCGLSNLVCSDPIKDYDSEQTFRGLNIEELSRILHDYANIHVAESFDEVVFNDNKKESIFKKIFRRNRK